jgi:hypothetical protein
VIFPKVNHKGELINTLNIEVITPVYKDLEVVHTIEKSLDRQDVFPHNVVDSCLTLGDVALQLAVMGQVPYQEARQVHARRRNIAMARKHDSENKPIPFLPPVRIIKSSPGDVKHYGLVAFSASLPAVMEEEFQNIVDVENASITHFTRREDVTVEMVVSDLLVRGLANIYLRENKFMRKMFNNTAYEINEYVASFRSTAPQIKPDNLRTLAPLIPIQRP